MRKPKMILFDYGHTLAYEPDTDFLRGERAVFRHMTANPHHVTPEEACQLGLDIYQRQRICRENGFEMHQHQQLLLKYHSLGLTFDLPMDEVEQLLWQEATPGAPMPGAANMLADLAQRNIRTGVISNIGWSGKALSHRLERLLGHRFEMVLTSSEYGVRKPDPLLFQAALGLASLNARDVWYCGDKITKDVHAAASVGIFPVWYQDSTVEDPFPNKNAGVPITVEHLHITHWTELLNALDQCKE